MDTVQKSQAFKRKLISRQNYVVLIFAFIIFLLLAGLFFFYALRSQSHVSQDTVDYTNRSRLINLVSIKSLACRRYEKDFFLNIKNEEIRGNYFYKWERASISLDKSIKSLCQLPSDSEHSLAYMRLRSASKRYEEGFLSVIEKVTNGEISTSAKANFAMLSVKTDIRQVIRDSEKHSFALKGWVDDSRKRLEHANIVVATGALGCGIAGICFVVWLIGATRQSSAHARTVSEYANQLSMSKDRAEVANQSKSDFLANMSHEIRTPMTAILGFTDILLDDLIKPTNIDAALTIKKNGEHLIELINDILDLSKVESGKLKIEEISCSPYEIVTEVVSLLKVKAAKKEVALHVRFEGQTPETISTDPLRLRQILTNIVGNAIKFTEVGSIEIVTRLLNESNIEPKLQFDIIDTGIGISEDAVEKIFLSFSQADSSTTRQFGGTGLGLTISKKLTELLGGDISVSSTVGKGSTFSFTVSTGLLENVRMIRSTGETIDWEAGKSEVTKTTVPLLNRRILIAEDGPDNQRLLSVILKKAGAEITLADNGRIGFDLASQAMKDNAPYDVILMDMQMPILDGYQATQQLRENGYRWPIIALTAHAMASDRQKCLEAGCDDYASKPINRKNIISLVHQYASSQPFHLAKV